MSSAPLPDATRQNWVDAHAPEGWKPWLKLGRFDRPIGIWLLLLPGWQGISLAIVQYGIIGEASFYLRHCVWFFAAFAIGSCLMRAAGCAFNDIVDRDIDAKVSRTSGRPIPSGRISVKQAWLFILGCSLVSLVTLLTMNLATVLLGIGSLALVAAYPFMKRITWWPQAWLGMTFNWGALMGFAAVTSLFPWESMIAALLKPGMIGFHLFWGMPGHLALSALLLWLGGVFWTLGYDTIYALQDIEDDAMVGVKSSARRLGNGVGRGVAIFYGLAVLMAGLAGFAAGLEPLFYLGLAAYAAHLIWQVRRLRLDDAALALALFKSNREAGLILLAAIVLGSANLGSIPF